MTLDQELEQAQAEQVAASDRYHELLRKYEAEVLRPKRLAEVGQCYRYDNDDIVCAKIIGIDDEGWYRVVVVESYGNQTDISIRSVHSLDMYNQITVTDFDAAVRPIIGEVVNHAFGA